MATADDKALTAAEAWDKAAYHLAAKERAHLRAVGRDQGLTLTVLAAENGVDISEWHILDPDEYKGSYPHYTGPRSRRSGRSSSSSKSCSRTPATWPGAQLGGCAPRRCRMGDWKPDALLLPSRRPLPIGRQTIGCSDVASDRRFNTARATRNRSGGGAARRPKATFTASRCGGASRSTAQQRTKDLVECSEGKPRVRLNPGANQHLAALCQRCHVLQ